ncbi:PIN domain-containing protein [Sulfurisphaera javensis]|uniref:PIN domain-containing protein n=1 Tax=Sulfurisphaera javensis TaxID=2049879 RepID=A0AAT9GT82_9CREN
MILATLGSNKLVTTTNAILTEVFTGLKPDEIVILAEEQSKRDYSKIAEILKVLGINAKVTEKIMGRGIEEWRNKLKDLKIDVADITPGRKYMALAVYTYSNAHEIRYIYLEKEEEGYRIFGYAPFTDVRIYDLRNSSLISYDPPQTIKGGNKNVELGREGIRALLNLYLLLGNEIVLNLKSEEGSISLTYDGNKLSEISQLANEYKTCLVRSGFFVYEAEDNIKRLASDKDNYFIADVNVYINLGNRLSNLIKNGNQILFSSSTYSELENMLNTTQKNDKKLYIGNLGMDSFKKIHNTIPAGYVNKKLGSDIKLIKEAMDLKGHYPNVILLTCDQGVYNSAHQKIKTVLLKELRNGKGSVEELIYCLRYFADIDLEINGKVYATIKRERMYGKDKLSLINQEEKYNYPYFISLVENYLKGEN